jgi:predicted ATPase
MLKGFKSIKEMDLELRPLNVLIGANGSGKSNLVSFFKMLNEMMAGRLQQYIGTTGRAQSLLYFGPKTTPEMNARMELQVSSPSDGNQGTHGYQMCLTHAAGDALVFAEETIFFEESLTTYALGLGSGHQETRMSREVEQLQFKRTAALVQNSLNRFRVYHFHDTSPTARVRLAGYIRDNRALLSDAGNLAAVLLDLQNYNNSAYRRIVSTIRQVAPFFEDFDLEAGTGDKEIFLNWRHKESDQLWGPHQLSDGTLRAICLITLLMQPEDGRWPDLVVVDEPELGLHPYALNVIAALFKKASRHTQVLVSTQSSSFLDQFDPEDIIVVNRDGNESKFSRPEPENLEKWLEEYSLGEVWEKNVIGGGPH